MILELLLLLLLLFVHTEPAEAIPMYASGVAPTCKQATLHPFRWKAYPSFPSRPIAAQLCPGYPWTQVGLCPDVFGVIVSCCFMEEGGESVFTVIADRLPAYPLTP